MDGMSDKQLKVLLREYSAQIEEFLKLNREGKTEEANEVAEKFNNRVKEAINE